MKRRGPEMCTFGVLGLCEAPAAPKAARERKKRENGSGRGKKKREILQEGGPRKRAVPARGRSPQEGGPRKRAVRARGRSARGGGNAQTKHTQHTTTHNTHTLTQTHQHTHTHRCRFLSRIPSFILSRCRFFCPAFVFLVPLPGSLPNPSPHFCAPGPPQTDILGGRGSPPPPTPPLIFVNAGPPSDCHFFGGGGRGSKHNPTFTPRPKRCRVSWLGRPIRVGNTFGPLFQNV